MVSRRPFLRRLLPLGLALSLGLLSILPSTVFAEKAELKAELRLGALAVLDAENKPTIKFTPMARFIQWKALCGEAGITFSDGTADEYLIDRFYLACTLDLGSVAEVVPDVELSPVMDGLGLSVGIFAGRDFVEEIWEKGLVASFWRVNW